MTKVIERIFEPLDATVIVVPETLTVDELDEIFGELDYEKRYYPTDSGWDIRFCTADVGELDFIEDTDIRIQKDAWDHEHCMSCESDIGIGDTFYTLHESEDSTRILCSKCKP